jgi:hypothetical protein
MISLFIILFLLLLVWFYIAHKDYMKRIDKMEKFLKEKNNE